MPTSPPRCRPRRAGGGVGRRARPQSRRRRRTRSRRPRRAPRSRRRPRGAPHAHQPLRRNLRRQRTGGAAARGRRAACGRGAAEAGGRRAALRTRRRRRRPRDSPPPSRRRARTLGRGDRQRTGGRGRSGRGRPPLASALGGVGRRGGGGGTAGGLRLRQRVAAAAEAPAATCGCRPPSRPKLAVTLATSGALFSAARAATPDGSAAPDALAAPTATAVRVARAGKALTAAAAAVVALGLYAWCSAQPPPPPLPPDDDETGTAAVGAADGVGDEWSADGWSAVAQPRRRRGSCAHGRRWPGRGRGGGGGGGASALHVACRGRRGSALGRTSRLVLRQWLAAVEAGRPPRRRWRVSRARGPL